MCEFISKFCLCQSDIGCVILKIELYITLAPAMQTSLFFCYPPSFRNDVTRSLYPDQSSALY